MDDRFDVVDQASASAGFAKGQGHLVTLTGLDWLWSIGVRRLPRLPRRGRQANRLLLRDRQGWLASVRRAHDQERGVLIPGSRP